METDFFRAMQAGAQFLSQAIASVQQVQMERARFEQEVAHRERLFKLQQDHLALEQEDLALRRQVEARRAAAEQAKITNPVLDFDQLLSAKNFEDARKLINEQRALKSVNTLLWADSAQILDPETRQPIPAQFLMRGADLDKLVTEASNTEKLVAQMEPATIMENATVTPEFMSQLQEFKVKARALRAQARYVADRISVDPTLRTMNEKFEAALGRASGAPMSENKTALPAAPQANADGALSPPGAAPKAAVTPEGRLAPLEALVRVAASKTGPDFDSSATELISQFRNLYRTTDRSQRLNLWNSFQAILTKHGFSQTQVQLLNSKF